MQPAFQQWFRIVALLVAILFVSPWILDLVYFVGGTTAAGWGAAGILFLGGLFLVLRTGNDSRAR